MADVWRAGVLMEFLCIHTMQLSVHCFTVVLDAAAVSLFDCCACEICVVVILHAAKEMSDIMSSIIKQPYRFFFY